MEHQNSTHLWSTPKKSLIRIKHREMDYAAEVVWKVSIEIWYLITIFCQDCVADWIQCNWCESTLNYSLKIHSQLSIALRVHWVCSPLTVRSEPPPSGSVLPNPAGFLSAYMVGRMSEMCWILILCSSLCVRSGLGQGVKHIPEGVEGRCF